MSGAPTPLEDDSPVPSGEVPGTSSPPGGSSRAWVRQNLEHSLPFVLVGAVCIVLAAWLALGHDHSVGLREGFVALLAAVGVTLGAGGIALTLIQEPEPEPSLPLGDDFVVVPRTEWEAWQRERAPLLAEEPSSLPGIPGVLPPVTGPAPAAEPSPGMPRAYDAASVARASERLLGALPPGTPSPPPAEPPRSIGPPPAVPLSAGARPAPSTAPTPGRPTPAAAVPPVSPPSPPVERPIWQEEPIQELESVLAELARDEAELAPRVRPHEPAAPTERCIGCGGEISAYSELVCVVCGRPLCDTCLEQSVSEQRPAICPRCAPPVRG